MEDSRREVEGGTGKFCGRRKLGQKKRRRKKGGRDWVEEEREE